VSVADVVGKVEAAGVAFRLDGEKVRVSYPDDERRTELAEQIAWLRAQRAEVAAYLKARSAIPSMPPGVRLVLWRPLDPPVILTRLGVVTNVPGFVRSTLSQLDSALQGKEWLSGHWSAREHIDRLEQCGVIVELETKSGQ
jgi:hypothetical protein